MSETAGLAPFECECCGRGFGHLWDEYTDGDTLACRCGCTWMVSSDGEIGAYLHCEPVVACIDRDPESYRAQSDRLEVKREFTFDAASQTGTAFVSGVRVFVLDGERVSPKRLVDRLMQELARERRRHRTALLCYHSMALASGRCGESLDLRCWACAELERYPEK